MAAIKNHFPYLRNHIEYLLAPPRLSWGIGGMRWCRMDSPCWRHTRDTSSSSSTAPPIIKLSTASVAQEPLDIGSFVATSTRSNAGWLPEHSVTDRWCADWPRLARLPLTVPVLPPGVASFLSFVSSANFSVEMSCLTRSCIFSAFQQHLYYRH